MTAGGRVVRIVTRGSKLALAQTNLIVEQLRKNNPKIQFEIATIRTTGDRITNRPLSAFRGTGVFVKGLERALQQGKADLAVHSLKDVPSEVPADLRLVVFPPRDDPRDLLLSRHGEDLGELPDEAVVGTSSPRRQVQLAAARPDLRFADLRGNLDTRIRKLRRGEYHAIVVAAAGMLRLGIPFHRGTILPVATCLPAPGQGTLVIEGRGDDEESTACVAGIGDPATRIAAQTERLLMATLGGGCALPLGALADLDGDRLRLRAAIGDPARRTLVRSEHEGPAGEWERVAWDCAETIIAACRDKGISIS